MDEKSKKPVTYKFYDYLIFGAVGAFPTIVWGHLITDWEWWLMVIPADLIYMLYVNRSRS